MVKPYQSIHEDDDFMTETPQEDSTAQPSYNEDYASYTWVFEDTLRA